MYRSQYAGKMTVLSRPSKVKCDGVIDLLIYDFLLVCNSNSWPNSGLLRDITLMSYL